MTTTVLDKAEIRRRRRRREEEEEEEEEGEGGGCGSVLLVRPLKRQTGKSTEKGETVE